MQNAQFAQNTQFGQNMQNIPNGQNTQFGQNTHYAQNMQNMQFGQNTQYVQNNQDQQFTQNTQYGLNRQYVQNVQTTPNVQMMENNQMKNGSMFEQNNYVNNKPENDPNFKPYQGKIVKDVEAEDGDKKSQLEVMVLGSGYDLEMFNTLKMELIELEKEKIIMKYKQDLMMMILKG